MGMASSLPMGKEKEAGQQACYVYINVYFIPQSGFNSYLGSHLSLQLFNNVMVFSQLADS